MASPLDAALGAAMVNMLARHLDAMGRSSCDVEFKFDKQGRPRALVLRAKRIDDGAVKRTSVTETGKPAKVAP